MKDGFFRAYETSESTRTKVSQLNMYSNSVSYFVGFQTMQIFDLKTMLYHPAKVLSLYFALLLDSSQPRIVIAAIIFILHEMSNNKKIDFIPIITIPENIFFHSPPSKAQCLFGKFENIL